jgi:hypothetical protein
MVRRHWDSFATAHADQESIRPGLIGNLGRPQRQASGKSALRRVGEHHDDVAAYQR